MNWEKADYDQGDSKEEVANQRLSQTHQFQESVHTEAEDQKIGSLKTVHALWSLESFLVGR